MFVKVVCGAFALSHPFSVCPRLGVGEPPESSDRDRWNRGDSESSSSSRRRGETRGLEEALCAGQAPPPSGPMRTQLRMQSTSMGAGLRLELGRSSSTGSWAGLGLEVGL